MVRPYEMVSPDGVGRSSLFYSRVVRPRGKEVSEGLAGMTASQIEGHIVEVLADPAPDLSQPQPEGCELQVWDVETR